MNNNDLTNIKNNYKEIANSLDTTCSVLEVAQKYLVETDKHKKDVYTAFLILYCWPALEKLYYKQNVKILSQAECYDIFMDSFLYVMEKHVWTDENNKLYNDKDAILKAMYVLVESRRKNYFIAQNRQKRAVNQYPLSLDVLSDEFQEGHFLPVTEIYNFDRGWEKKFITGLWHDKKYISAIIFDVIMNLNVFEDDGISFKKIKKYVKHFSKNQYTNFLKRYDIIDNDFLIYQKYVVDLTDNIIYLYITQAVNDFKTDLNLKEIKENHVD